MNGIVGANDELVVAGDSTKLDKLRAVPPNVDIPQTPLWTSTRVGGSMDGRA
jgi:hypothetical protein